jgi:hypothetical protein
MRTPILAVCVAAGCLLASSAFAQLRPPPDGAQTHQELRVGASEGFVVHSSWSARDASGRRTTEVRLGWLDANLRPTPSAAVVHRGDSALVSSALRSGAAFVLLVHGGQGAWVRGAILARGQSSPITVDIARRAGMAPTRGVACSTPDGFAFLWQETVGDLDGSVQTWFGRLRADGTWLQQPAIVGVQWGFGAMEWNGRGYHLALFYDGTAYGQTRLTMVTLSAAGQPEQHPWWVSRPEAVGEVQLLSTLSGMVAVWRGGADETTLHSMTQAGVGSWGAEAPQPQSHGAILPSATYALRRSGNGGVEVVRR